MFGKYAKHALLLLSSSSSFNQPYRRFCATAFAVAAPFFTPATRIISSWYRLIDVGQYRYD
jgi:hypothetical protein